LLLENAMGKSPMEKFVHVKRNRKKKFTRQKKTQKMLEISSILENHQHKVFLTYFY